MHRMKIPALGCWARRAYSAVTSLKPWLSFNQQLRFKATQQDCKHLEPKCGDRFKQGACLTRQIDVKLKQPTAATLPVQERSIQLKRAHECCGSPCPGALPRFDVLYYKHTNKFERDYQQTWNECPELVKKPKIVCCFRQIIPAKFKKRPRLERPPTACQQTCASTQAKCPYVTLRGCRPAKHPPKCKPGKVKILNCKKRQTPSPAFSECISNLPRIRPVECRCLLMPSICEVWAYNRYLQRTKKIRLC